jgi:hypothetical protein
MGIMDPTLELMPVTAQHVIRMAIGMEILVIIIRLIPPVRELIIPTMSVIVHAVVTIVPVHRVLKNAINGVPITMNMGAKTGSVA